jgi:putative ABC transport system permease protein
MGGSRATVFSMVMLEGLILAVLGGVCGLLLGHIGMSIVAGLLQESYHYGFSGRYFLKEDLILVALAAGIGILAAVFPAVRASRADISKTLSKG